MENRFNIDLAFLPDDEAERLYRRYPYIGEDSESYCPTCEKRGTIQWKGKTWKCDCHHQLQLYKHYLAAGIGVTYQRLEWQDIEGNDKIIEDISKYLEKHQQYVNRGVGLFFSGPVGTGKTMLANLVLKWFVKYGYTCFATTFAQTIDYLTAGWSSPEDKVYFRRKFVESQVLLLDDVGREHRTKLSDTTFDSILRTRVQEGRPTIITTNMNFAEIQSGYGAAVLSLLKESSISFEFEGEDFRPKSQQRTVDEVRAGLTRPIT
jgi:DNA replication protein DnaC